MQLRCLPGVTILAILALAPTVCFAQFNQATIISTSMGGIVSGTYGYFKYVSATYGVGGSTADRITSGTTSLVAQSGGLISITTNGTNTGYFNSNGVLSVPGISMTANLTSVTTLYASGKVGIGTTSPATGLEVNDTITGRAGAGYLLKQSGVNTGLYLESDGSLSAFVNGSRYWTAGNGLVGIGTTNPSATLHVGGDIEVKSNGNLQSYSVDRSSYGMIQLYNGGTGNTVISNTFFGADILLLPTATGKVGIATSKPNAQLEVNGIISASGVLGTSIGGYGGAFVGASGVYGTSNGSGSGVYGVGSNGNGVYGTSTSGYGGYFAVGPGGIAVYGSASTSYGGRFSSTSGAGVYATSSSNYGGYFSSSSSTGLQGESSGSSGAIAVYAKQNSSGGHAFLGQNSGSGYYCYIGYASSYSIICSGPTSGISDGRLKKDVVPLDVREGLAAIMALKPVSYRWLDERRNHGGDKHYRELGFIAQDVEKVLPELVGESEQPSDSLATSPVKGKIKSLEYDRLAAPMVKAIQELKADNDNLRAEFEAYKSSHP